MKQTMKSASTLLLLFLLLFSVVSCTEKSTDLWASATYLTDTTLGDGAHTVTVEVTAEEKTVVFTVNTDKETLGDALYEHGIINDPSFFDVCNGMKADWDKDHTYWAFYVGDEYASFGVNDEQAVTADAPVYRIVYTK